MTATPSNETNSPGPSDGPEKRKYLLCDGKLLEPVDNPLYSGWQQATDIEVFTGQPRFRWKGAKMPFELWSQIVCFMRWGQAEIKEETMLFMFYNLKTHVWAAWVFPQLPSGMSVRMLDSHSLYAEDRKKFGNDWIQAGTVHHHCEAGAFQSGTDKADEEDRDGLHVTLGKMSQPILDIHCRQVFDGVQTETRIIDWVEIPTWLAPAPKSLRYDIFQQICVSVRDIAFPDEWKSRVFKYLHQANACDKNHRGTVTTAGFTPGVQSVGDANTGKTTLIGINSINSTNPNSPSGTSAGHPSNTGGTQHWAEEYKQTRMARVASVLARLAMSPMDAYYLTTKPNLSPEEMVDRNLLREGFLREGIVWLYASDLCFALWQEEDKAQKTETTVNPT